MNRPPIEEIEARAVFAANDVTATDRQHGTYLFAYSQDIPALLEYVKALEAAITDYARSTGDYEGADFIDVMPAGRSREIVQSLVEGR